MRIGRHQTGAALLTAMLTVTLVATLAANAMWQHWRNVEAEAAERVRIQQAWLLAGALDWARALLRQDALNNQTDHLAEPWALPMPETRLAGLLADDKNDRISDDPSLDGYVSIRITDMQSRLNVNNLIEGEGHHISESGLIAFRRLFRLLDLPLSQLTLLAENLRLAGGPGKPPTPLRPNRIEELISLGLPPSTLDALQPFVALLPEQTPVNLNTASAEVIYASVPGLELGQAQRIVNARTAAHFRSPAMALQAAGVMAIPVDAVSLSVNSRYFQVHARLRQAASEMQGRWLLTRDESDVLALQHMRGAGLAAARAFQATGVN